jgi:uncharacterized membrane protein/protein-disulfide isomerase
MMNHADAGVVEPFRRFAALAAPSLPLDCMVEALLTHPRFPNAGAIIDTMRDAGVECAAVRAGANELDQLSCPSLLFLNSGDFAVLEKVDSDRALWTHSRAGRQWIAFVELAKSWTGIALIIDGVSPRRSTSPCGGTPGLHIPLATVAAAVGAGLVITTAVGYTQLSALAVFLSHIAGSAIALLLGDRGASRLQAMLCPSGSAFDCRRVLDGPDSRFLGIALTDWAAAYFLTGTISTGFALMTGAPVLALSAWMSLAMIPVVAASIYAQAFVVRAWCAGCLAIDAILVLQAAGLARFRGPIGAGAIKGEGLGLSLAVLLIAMRNRTPPGAVEMRRRYLRLKRNPAVLASLLATTAPLPPPPPDILLLTYGSQDAPSTITLITSPYCPSCADAHQALEALMEHALPLRVCVTFLCDPDRDLPGNRAVLCAHALLVLGRENEARHLIKAWFASIAGRRPFDDEHTKALAATLDANAVVIAEASLRTQSDWALALGIDATPVIALNGRRLPHGYSLQDLSDLDLRELGRVVALQPTVSG